MAAVIEIPLTTVVYALGITATHSSGKPMRRFTTGDIAPITHGMHAPSLAAGGYKHKIVIHRRMRIGRPKILACIKRLLAQQLLPMRRARCLRGRARILDFDPKQFDGVYYNRLYFVDHETFDLDEECKFNSVMTL
jgi:hypothetical protein